MSADPYANQQEIYELRSQLDRAYIRIDELIEENKALARNWQELYITHIKLVERVGAIEASKAIRDE